MSGMAVAMMVLICGFVWGGFSILLLKALRSERAKNEVGDEG